MTTITRRDGVVFVTQAYRELLRSHKRSGMTREIRMQSQQQGSFVALFKKDNSAYEAVFSEESGYLLGESVRAYLGNVNDLIYCEALPDGESVLLVVVRDGTVYLDNKMLIGDCEAELVPLLMGEHRYHLYVRGDVPLSNIETPDKVYFPPEFVEAFHVLEQSLFNRLPTQSPFQLLPLPFILRSDILSYRKHFLMAGAMGGFLLLISWLAVFTTSRPSLPSTTPVAIVRPFVAFDRALETPDPAKLLHALASQLQTYYTLPGWDVESVSFADSRITTTLRQSEGDMQSIEAWTKDHHATLDFNNEGGIMTQQLSVASREKPRVIYPAKKVVDALADQFDALFSRHAVTVGPTRLRGKTRQVLMSVSFESLSPAMFDVMADELSDMPVALQSVQATVTGGLYSGRCQLAVWGE